MKVYIIIHKPMWSEESPEIVKVVGSEEKAKEFCKNREMTIREWILYKEYEVD